MIYEYAGFLYDVTENSDGTITLKTVPGQHPAASKIKHHRAAVECYVNDKKAGKL